MLDKLLKANGVDVKLEVAELKQKLADTDYICNKIVEGVATKEDYADLLAQRESWRERIRNITENL